MNKCQHCGQRIHWDNYWTTWDHSDREYKLDAELCTPSLGFHGSTYATPQVSERPTA